MWGDVCHTSDFFSFQDLAITEEEWGKMSDDDKDNVVCETLAVEFGWDPQEREEEEE